MFSPPQGVELGENLPMDLIPPELFGQLLANGAAAREEPAADPMPVLKWFNPCGAATWLITELDPHDQDSAYGLCDLCMGAPELGYVSVRELAAIGLLGGAVGIARDLHWRPDKPLSAYARLARAAGRILS